MENFTKADKVVYLIQSNHHLIPVIHRFGFRLGFGNKTVEELCLEFKINSDFFIAIVNTFHSKSFFPKEKLLTFSPLLIIDYLKKTHRYYIEYTLPRLDKLIHDLQISTVDQNVEMKMIEEFYLKYKKRLLEHIKDEEERVFPLIEQIVNNPSDSHNNVLFNVDFDEEHEHVDFELDDLKTLIIKYISPVYNEFICNELLDEIFRFENDIHNHARIEDAILIPQVQLLTKRT